MKQLSGFLVLLFFSLLFFACNPCKDVICFNGGVCDDGTCLCPDGFSGVNCETTDDPCIGVVCFNGGVCDDGTCLCPDGYSGLNCETPDDDCIGVPCENGICILGDCTCDIGYEGITCDVRVTTKFVGSFSVTETCDSTGLDFYTATINESITEINQIEFDNLYDVGESVSGTLLSSTAFEIPGQAFGLSVIWGDGYLNFDGMDITIDFSIQFPDLTIYVCSVELDRM